MSTAIEHLFLAFKNAVDTNKLLYRNKKNTFGDFSGITNLSWLTDI